MPTTTRTSLTRFPLISAPFDQALTTQLPPQPLDGADDSGAVFRLFRRPFLRTNAHIYSCETFSGWSKPKTSQTFNFTSEPNRKSAKSQHDAGRWRWSTTAIHVQVVKESADDD